MSSMLALEELHVGNNLLTFEDIEPNIGVPSATFLYSPQANIGVEQNITKYIAYDYTFSVPIVAGANNLYQWFKDATAIPGATSHDYTNNSIQEQDAGDYTCQVSNTVATDLIIYSEPTHLQVPHQDFTTLPYNTGFESGVGIKGG